MSAEPGQRQGPTVPDETFAQACRTSPRGDGVWDATFHPSYWLWNQSFVHGGLGLATAVDAMARAADRPDPVTVTGHFMAQVKPEPAEVRCEVVRSGGRHSTVVADLVQGGDAKLRLVGTFGDTSFAEGPSHHREAPDCASWDECRSMDRDNRFFSHVEVAFDPATFGFLDGKPTGSDRSCARVRFRKDEPVAGPALAFLADIMWSPAQELGLVGMAWIPTVELTMHVHDSSWRGEVLVQIRLDHLSNGYATEDVEIWAGDGSRLLAVARQLALVRSPD